jgi:hypothetical protein
LRMICSDREPDGSTFFLAMSLLHGLWKTLHSSVAWELVSDDKYHNSSK